MLKKAIQSIFLFSILGAMSPMSFAVESNQNKITLHQILSRESATPQTTQNDCTYNWECTSWEHCLNGTCQDTFNRCYNNLDCWPAECVDGVCTN